MTPQEIVHVKPDDVLFDIDCQREFDEGHPVFKEVFDPKMFGLGAVSIRADGTIVGLDAQHRGHAAKQAGYGQVKFPYQAFRNLTKEEEAQLFIRFQQGRKRVSVVDQYRVGLVAKDEMSMAIKSVLNQVGIENTPWAIQSLVRVYKQNGRTGLWQTLTVLTNAWGRGKDALEGILIKGVGAFLAGWRGKIDLSRLIRLLQKNTSPQGLIGQIRARKANVKELESAAKSVLQEIYNKGLGEDKRLK